MNRTRIKICGITREQDAIAAVEAGVDAIGLVFYSKSSRHIDSATAKKIADLAGPFVTIVGLFVNASIAEVQSVTSRVGLNLLQFHGDENDKFCSQFQCPYIKAVRMSPELDVQHQVAEFPSSRGILFDAWSKDKYGGTGEVFNWTRLSFLKGGPYVLAGGLTPDNVAEAIATVKPYAVDVSGGVEVSPGIKSPELIQQFVQRVKAASNTNI